jgi:hypothetical protein
MAAMTTALTEFSDNGDSRTYTYSGHSASNPRLVIQQRKVPVGNQVMAEASLRVISGTEDADGLPLTQRVVFSGSCRYPITGDYADVTAALAIFRDAINGDEWTNTCATLEWLA